MLLEDLAALIARDGAHPEALLQLDYKEDAAALTPRAVATFAEALGPVARHFILSSGDADSVRLLAAGVAGLRIGYDPCHMGALERLTASRAYPAFVADALAASPDAELIYLDHALVLAAADDGFDLVAAFHAAGRRVDAYTLPRADAAGLATARRLLALEARPDHHRRPRGSPRRPRLTVAADQCGHPAEAPRRPTRKWRGSLRVSSSHGQSKAPISDIGQSRGPANRRGESLSAGVSPLPPEGGRKGGRPHLRRRSAGAPSRVLPRRILQLLDQVGVRRRIGDDHRPGPLVDLRPAPPPVGHHAPGLLDQQHAHGPVDEPRFLEVPGQPPAGDVGAGVGRAPDDPDRPDRVADLLQPRIVAFEACAACGSAARCRSPSVPTSVFWLTRSRAPFRCAPAPLIAVNISSATGL